MKIINFIAIIVGFSAVPASAETLNNDSILALIAAGLGDEVVIAKISTSTASYDLSTASVIALQGKGVSGPVLAAMINASSVKAAVASSLDSPDPLVPHPSGIYLSGPDKMTRIELTVTRQARTSGIWGAAFTAGLTGLRTKAAINGLTASVRTSERQPVFYFYFDQTAQGLGSSSASATSPNEFSLIVLKPKKDKREAIIGSVGLSGPKTGLRDKDQQQFRADQIAPGVYKVTPSGDLLPGEYGFFTGSVGIAGGVGTGASASFRVFDFAVQ